MAAHELIGRFPVSPRFVIFSSYGNDSVALIQWAHEQGLRDVVVVYSDTQWAADWWAARVEKLEWWVRSLGFWTDRTTSVGIVELAKQKTDPTNMMVVHMSQTTGREWSKSDLDRMLRDSPEIKKLLKPGRQNDNTYDKEFLSGMRLTVTWPTANNLSGKTIRYNWLMDYDRMPDSVDGEGNAYDLTKKRATTFKRFGMTVAESSPNPAKEISNPKWTPPHKHSHLAPPIAGIFELYNRGDRRRWNWACPTSPRRLTSSKT